MAATAVENDCEPGASSEPMLVAEDDATLAATTTTSDAFFERSGTISEIDQDSVQCLDELSLDDAATTTTSQSTVAVGGEEEEAELRPEETEAWRDKEKHIFVLSAAGKPIYSRYGSEEKLATTMGVMQALVSCVQDNDGDDVIRCLVAGERRFVFAVHGPVILVAVSRSSESAQQLALQLSYLFYQIVSVLTAAQLQRLFERRQNYDLRRLLAGAEKFLDNLMVLVEREPSFLLGAVKCLPLAPAVRDAVTSAIVHSCAKVKNLVFAILLAANQLVTLVRMKKYFLHPIDLHLVMNLVDASESFRTVESWTPICLPKFDSSGFLHGHISYLTEECNACLLLLTVDRDLFFQLSECKAKIVEKLESRGCLDAIQKSVVSGSYKACDTNIPKLWHFLYKVRSTAQYTSPALGVPFITEQLQRRLFGLYTRVHQRMHQVGRPLKVLYQSGQEHTVVAQVMPGFELYAVFDPLVTKSVASSEVRRLLFWIKSVEDQLFILNSPTF